MKHTLKSRLLTWAARPFVFRLLTPAARDDVAATFFESLPSVWEPMPVAPAPVLPVPARATAPSAPTPVPIPAPSRPTKIVERNGRWETEDGRPVRLVICPKKYRALQLAR